MSRDGRTNASGSESLRVHSPRLTACAVIPYRMLRYPADSDSDREASRSEASYKDAGIQKPGWMPDQGRHDMQYLAACGVVVYFALNVKIRVTDL